LIRLFKQLSNSTAGQVAALSSPPPTVASIAISRSLALTDCSMDRLFLSSAFFLDFSRSSTNARGQAAPPGDSDRAYARETLNNSLSHYEQQVSMVAGALLAGHTGSSANPPSDTDSLPFCNMPVSPSSNAVDFPPRTCVEEADVEVRCDRIVLRERLELSLQIYLPPYFLI
jgi:hypothetical protein